LRRRAKQLVFPSYFADFPDPQQRGKVAYPLQEILLLCLLAVFAGAETFVDIAWFGQNKIAPLRRFLPLHPISPARRGGGNGRCGHATQATGFTGPTTLRSRAAPGG